MLPLILIPETRILVFSSSDWRLMRHLIQTMNKISVCHLFLPIAGLEDTDKRVREDANIPLRAIFLYHFLRLCILIVSTGR